MFTTTVRAANDGVRLAGSLWKPDAVTPRALLVMQPGSGPSDRHNDTLFPPIRAALLDQGIAVCSFDKRGVGESGGSWLDADIRAQAADLASELAAARERLPNIPCGLFGHSQGGWVVLEASRSVRVDFVITNSGPGVSPAVQEQFSTRSRLAGEGLEADGLARSIAVFDELTERMLSAEPFEAVIAWQHAPVRAEAVDTLVRCGAFVPQEEAFWNFATRIAGYDPADALSEIRVPLLALFGGADPIVPVDVSADRFRKNVAEQLREVRVFPGADHRIQTTAGDFARPATSTSSANSSPVV